MIIRQSVQVRFLGSDRLYSYIHDWDTEAEERPLQVGDRVEVPPNVMQEDGGSGVVEILGSLYDGPMAKIVRRIP